MSDLNNIIDPAKVGASAANAALEQVMQPEVPLLATPPPADVDLACGWVDKDDTLWNSAVVRELNGRDEERLSQITNKPNLTVAQFIDQLLRLAVVQVGPEISVTPEMLDSLVIGDRLTLALAIRKLTWGPEIEFPEFQCQVCGEKFGVAIDIDSDIKYRTDVKDRVITIELRGGHQARVSLVTGKVERLIVDPEMTTSQQATLIINNCLQTIDEKSVKNMALIMGMKDRRKIIESLNKNQPGPLLEEGVSVPCSVCGKESTYFLSLVDLFRS